jgi:hypothetical protein
LNQKGKMMTGRQDPTLALVTPSLTCGNDGDIENMCLDAPNMETLKVELPVNTQEFKEIE